MLAFYRCFDKDYRYYPFKPKHAHDDPTSVPPKEITMLYASPDGLHWTPKGETGPSGDNTTFFYNPFRKKWISQYAHLLHTGQPCACAWLL